MSEAPQRELRYRHTLANRTITRRLALKQVCIAGAAGAVSIGGLSAALADKKMGGQTPDDGQFKNSAGKLFELEFELWRKSIGTAFHVSGAKRFGSAGSASLTLVDVTRIDNPGDGERPPGIRPHGISMLFSANDLEELDSGTYTFDTAIFGSLELFAHQVPRDEHPGQVIYEVALN